LPGVTSEATSPTRKAVVQSKYAQLSSVSEEAWVHRAYLSSEKLYMPDLHRTSSKFQHKHNLRNPLKNLCTWTYFRATSPKAAFSLSSTSNSLNWLSQKAVYRQVCRAGKKGWSVPETNSEKGGLPEQERACNGHHPSKPNFKTPKSWHANIMIGDPVLCLRNLSDSWRLLTFPLLPIIPRHLRQGKWGTLTSDSNRFFSVHFLYLDRECQANEMNY